MRSVLFDATRLFIRGSRFSPTGIDRVVSAYARWLLKHPQVNLQPVVTAGGHVWQVPRAVLARIVENAEIFRAAARSEKAVSASWSALMAALNADAESPGLPLRAKSIATQLPTRIFWHASLLSRSAWRLRPARAESDLLYINVSHTGLGDPGVLRRLAAKSVRNVIMVHDLIPIDYPEYCAPGARMRHVRRMDGIIDHSSLVIANSQTTADMLAAYANKIGRACPPTNVAVLGVEPDFLQPTSPLHVSQPYFVCVGTLEARKNLTLLLAVWRRLAERLGVAAPRLVLVGRRGWENESILDHLQRSEVAARLVHEVSDLPDAHLASLLAGARALLAPSFTEGFDLPVIESLSLGTPVIASDIPVHRELAAAATLVDPLDGPAWLEAIAATKAGRGPAFRAPRWEDHFAGLEDALLGGGFSDRPAASSR